MRSLWMLGLLAASALVRADHCQYFWLYQCIQVVDAQQRQIEQVLLLPDRLQQFPRAAEDSCQDQAEQRMSAIAEQLHRRFDQAARDYPQCQTPIGAISLRSHDDHQRVERQWQRALRPSAQKTLVQIEGLPAL